MSKTFLNSLSKPSTIVVVVVGPVVEVIFALQPIQVSSSPLLRSVRLHTRSSFFFTPIEPHALLLRWASSRSATHILNWKGRPQIYSFLLFCQVLWISLGKLFSRKTTRKPLRNLWMPPSSWLVWRIVWRDLTMLWSGMLFPFLYLMIPFLFRASVFVVVMSRERSPSCFLLTSSVLITFCLCLVSWLPFFAQFLILDSILLN